jgi:NADPH2:quinone reductase
MSVIGLWWGNYRLHNPRLIEDTQKRLYQMYEEGQIKPVIHSLVAFNDLPSALELVESRKSYGKIVIKVD